MNRLAFVAAAALFATAAVPALASEAPRSGMDAQGRRVVTTCERDPLTQTAFRAQHGASPVFVTADHVVNSAGERWSAPRCMTVREQQRLARMMSPRNSR
ncbi:hypothetical protein BH10PSE2_BH10PSE2_13790 [soil metagenome]